MPLPHLLGKLTDSQSSLGALCWPPCELPCWREFDCCTEGEPTNVVLSTYPGSRPSTAPSCLTDTDVADAAVGVVTRLKGRASLSVSVCLPPPLVVLVLPEHRHPMRN